MEFLAAADSKITAFEKFVAFLDAQGNIPGAYGIFHIISLLIIFAVCALVFVYRKRLTEKFIACFTLVCGIIMIVFEIYKQLVFSYHSDIDLWKYSVYSFPFQFCSTPMYIAVIAFVLYKLKKERLYKAMLSFLATYSLIAGFVVLFVGTGTVFCSTLGVNIQTMVHHGIMFVLATAILVSGAIEFNKRALLDAFFVFAPLLVIAMILNFSIDGLDMFYIAPDSKFVFKSISDIFFGGKLPYPVYLVGYIILFTLGSALILFIGNKITKKTADSK